MLFADRREAGRRLAVRLMPFRGSDVVVLGLPRGGVPVAYEVARALHAPLDVIVVRKLGVPIQPELAMGAIGEEGTRVVNEEVVRLERIPMSVIDDVEARERTELQRRVERFRRGRRAVPIAGCTVIIVDDGIATGSTARAACQVARARGAKRVVLAAPVAPKEWTRRLGDAADEYVCVATPEPFFAIGAFYGDFSPTSEEDVVDCLREIPTPPPVIDLRLACDEHVKVKAGPVILDGHLTVPENAKGMIVFAHGSGSSARSPRNQHVAAVLNQAGLATLLFDLLTPIEALDRSKVFDVDLLAKRLTDATHWLEWVPAAQGLPIAFFGASTGAAAALTAAATLGHDITAVVSRGGRPDLADRDLPRVVSPTLLIVGGKDDIVLELNQNVITRMHCESNLVIVPGATHLFDEPGTLEQAATLARDWFVAHFATARAGSSTR